MCTENNCLNYEDTIKEARETASRYRWKLGAALLMLAVINSIIYSFVEFFLKSSSDKSFDLIIGGIFGFILNSFLLGGILNAAISSARYLEWNFNTVFSGFKWLGRIFSVGLMLNLAVLIGLIFFVVPGIYIAMKYFLAPYYIIDKNMTVEEALTASSNATNGLKWDIFKMYFKFSLILLLIYSIIIACSFAGLLFIIDTGIVAKIIYVMLMLGILYITIFILNPWIALVSPTLYVAINDKNN